MSKGALTQVIDDPRTGAIIIDDEEAISDPMLSLTQDLEDMKKHIDISKLRGKQNEDKLAGFYQEIGANCGALVVSIEGEDWEWGNEKHKRVAILGYFYKAIEINGGMLRVQFTSLEGAQTKRGTWKSDWDEHPLSAQRGGYTIPKKGGFAVMDDGWTLIVSKFGILSGKNAWDFAEEVRNILFKERSRTQQLQEALEDKNAQLQTLEEDAMQIGVERDSLLNEVKDIRSSLIAAQHTVNRLAAIKDSLMAEIEQWQDLDGYRRTVLLKMATDMNKSIETILQFVSIQKIDESIRAGASEHPRITEHLKERMMDELKHQNIVGKTDTEKELERMKREMESMKKIVERQQQQPQASLPPATEPRPAAPQPRNNGGEDDDGQGGGKNSGEDDNGAKDGGEDDAGSDGQDGGGEAEGQSGTGEEPAAGSGSLSTGAKAKKALGSLADEVKNRLRSE